MIIFDRNKEALAYFRLAKPIMEAYLGVFHTRTATV